AVGDSMGYLEASHFQQLVTAHGVTMIFFVGMGLMFGLINLIVPLQIGARDVAFPFLNNLSFWLFTSGGMFILVSLVIGEFAGTGWSAYPPLSGIKYNPGVGVDYWLWSVQISGAGSLLSGINFLVTILKMRCPGMTLMRMPIFVWTALATMILVIFAFPILTANVAMLSTDRLLDTKIFTPDFGGNPMMYINLFWAWGHPEVYILVLPAFGIFSEIVPVFSRKKLFGYASMVWAIVAITFLSFIVWLHHFFTMGAGANVNAFFGIMTMIIAIPTGIAHFHYVIIGGVVFGFMAGFTYWFPKFIGFTLNEKWGKLAFWFWLIGFLIAFSPLYLLGFMGATRRLNYYNVLGWQPLFIIAAVGAILIFMGVGFQLLQIYVSLRDRKKNRDVTGDPWNGRTLEWMTTSPPPFYNFAITPQVEDKDAFWVIKHQKGGRKEKPHYEEIHMPKNSSMGIYMGVLSFFLGFGLIWHIFWMAILSVVGIVACVIFHLSDKHPEYTVSAEEIEKNEKRNHFA
ncbi:MAG: cbb3-type cytochrome c oxidase subunit I, partial [Chlamydiales bacterium]|nr:cbb3-type cytochrome c oxidase subunit I [Chlamydiales bacterium]